MSLKRPNPLFEPSSCPEDFTVGWICAITAEAVAATVLLDEELPALISTNKNDNNIYTLGKIGQHKVVIAVLPDGEYGLCSATSVARDMLNTFQNLRFGFLVGIGGGAPSPMKDIRLGDIVVSLPMNGHGGVFQYDFGKMAQGRPLEPTLFLNQPPTVLRAAINSLKADQEINGNRIRERIDAVLMRKPRLSKKYGKPDLVSDRLYHSDFVHPSHIEGNCSDYCERNPANLKRREPRNPDDDDPVIHYGVIASANRLVKDAMFRDSLAESHGVLCFEMEAAGLMNNFPCIVVRGICDYSDTHKNKAWQCYAAMTAAAYAKSLLEKVHPTKVDALDSIKVMKSMTENVGRLVDYQDEKQRRAVLGWLSRADFAARHADCTRERQPGTGLWLLESPEYLTWTRQRGSTLFCPGIPGAGKTMITCAVIENLKDICHKNNTTGLCYVYCNYKSHHEHNIFFFLASMVEQLTWKLPLLPGSLTTLYKRHSEERTKPTVSEYVQILKLILEGLSTTYVIFDAIDECTYENNLCQNLLDVIFGLQRDCQLQLFVTSRFIPEIMRRFEGTNSVEIRASSQDVQRYLEENVKNLAACVQEDVALRTDICTTIAESIEGMFLLAKLHLDSLRNERRPKQIRSVLSSLKSRDPLNNVKALDLAYEKAIETVNGQHPNDAGLAKQILSWIVYAKRPLSITELQHALAVQDDANFDAVDLLNPQDILSVCAGLLTVDENTRIVRFLHYTAQEYFEKMPQIWLQDAQAAIALACISYLCKDAFATGVCDSDAAFEKRLRDFPLLDFASRYWGDYASKVTAAELQLRAMDFLRRSQNVACSIQVLRCSRHQSHEYSQKFALHSSGLHLAAHFGLKLLVTSIVENTDTVTDLRNSYGETPLAWAAKSGQESVVKLLVQRNDVDADSRNKYGQTPLAMAAEAGYMQVVKLLAERDDVEADSQSTNGWTPLLWAAINGHELMVNLLIKRDDVKAESRDSFYGQTPLSWAARNGHESVVKLLADHHDTEVDSRDSASQTPLLWAARNGHESIVKFFIGRKDVDVNSWDCVYGHTPLFWAARNGHELVLQTLIQRDDVEVDTADSWGRTPLSRAAEQGRELIVQCLIARADVDINSKDEYSQTPLGWAAENGHDSVVKLLVNRDDIEVDSKNYKGQTPLWQATRNGHGSVVQILLEKGAAEVQ